MDIIKTLENEQLRTDLPPLLIGDTVKIYVKVKEVNRCLKELLSPRRAQA